MNKKLKIKVGFIGYGKMGRALAEGAVQANVLRPTQVRAYDPLTPSRVAIRKQGFKLTKSISHLIESVDMVFICVKPQQMGEVLQDARRVTLRNAKKKCFVSIAAGVSLDRLHQGLGKDVALIRVMPNTPALLGAGMSAFTRGRYANVRHVSWVKVLLSSVGKVVQVSEKIMDAVTALSGSGPAYGFYLAEALIEAGEKLGIKKDLSRLLVHQTLFGAGLMLNERKEAASELRRQVTSPGGTTAAAISEFERHKFKKIVKLAVERASQRSRELSRLG